MLVELYVQSTQDGLEVRKVVFPAVHEDPVTLFCGTTFITAIELARLSPQCGADFKLFIDGTEVP